MTAQFAAFHVDGTLWGIPALCVREIIRHQGYFPVPRASSYIHGLMNLRGKIVTVLDLGRRLGSQSAGDVTRDVCIILKTDAEIAGLPVGQRPTEKIGSDIIGLLVDEMAEVIDVEEHAIDTNPVQLPRTHRRFVDGVVKLPDELMLVLALEPVLEL
jgi:purine-binding chemotaxis protein CheW